MFNNKLINKNNLLNSCIVFIIVIILVLIYINYVNNVNYESSRNYNTMNTMKEKFFNSPCSQYANTDNNLSNACLTEIWRNAGCTNLSVTQNYSNDGWWKFQNKNVVTNDMNLWATLADPMHANLCYGSPRITVAPTTQALTTTPRPAVLLGPPNTTTWGAWRMTPTNNPTWNSSVNLIGGSNTSGLFVVPPGTYYYGKTITLTDPTKISNAIFYIIADDNCNVYLNNVNIYFITHFAKFNFFRKNCLRDKASVVKYPHKIEKLFPKDWIRL